MGDSKTVCSLYGAGWHLISCGLGCYRLQKGEPAEYIYEADFAVVSGKDRNE